MFLEREIFTLLLYEKYIMINHFIRKLISVFVVTPYRILYKNNPLLYPFKFDNIATRNNMSFINGRDFERYHSKSIEFSGRDYRFYLRVHQALWCASVTKNVDGDFVELGTGRGYIFAAVCEYLRTEKINKSVYLFDTFLPYKTSKDTGEQKKGQKKSGFYAENYDVVNKKFSEFDFVILVQGKCPEILDKIYGGNNRKISFLHVDLNFHEVELTSLKLLWPYLSDSAIILLDDYANPGREIQYEAHNHFFDEKSLKILTTATGQGIVIKS
jgi:hypothetical protein